MSWLVAHVLVWMVLAGATGAALTTVLMTTRVTVEKWVEVAVERPEPAAVAASAVAPPAASAVASAAGDEPQQPLSDSPFPALPGAAPGERPWEAEELWSRPARLAEPLGGNRRTGTDEWSEAATSWRSWAEEATGRAAAVDGPVDDDDLFAADREAERRGVEGWQRSA